MSLKATLSDLERKFHDRFLKWSKPGGKELSPDQVKQCEQAVQDALQVGPLMTQPGYRVIEREFGRQIEVVSTSLLHLEPQRLRTMGAAQLKGVGLGLEMAKRLADSIVERGQLAQLRLAEHAKAMGKRGGDALVTRV